MGGVIQLDIGCGQSKLDGYIGVDIHQWPDVDMVRDVIKDGIGLPDESVSEIYTAHFLEHVGKFEVQDVLKEFYRVLKPGHDVTIIVPDLLKVLENFIDTPTYGREAWPLDTVFGGQAHEGEYHKTGFWPELLTSLLLTAGFINVSIIEMEGWGQPCLTAKATKP
jgi:predicted SAM-dependent methyltransferase